MDIQIMKYCHVSQQDLKKTFGLYYVASKAIKSNSLEAIKKNLSLKHGPICEV